MMLLKRRQVLCSNCGFLCWFVQHVSGEGPYKHKEIGKHARTDFQAGTFKGTTEDSEAEEYYHFGCIRNQWVWTSGSKFRSDYANADDVRKPRKCVYYISYEPAFGPEEHKELRREAETNRNIRNAVLLGAAIGAGAAIIIQLLYIFLLPLLK